MAKSEYTNYLKAKRYCIEIIMEAFKKIEPKPRRECYKKQPKKNSEREGDRVIPLVADFNPGLP